MTDIKSSSHNNIAIPPELVKALSAHTEARHVRFPIASIQESHQTLPEAFTRLTLVVKTASDSEQRIDLNLDVETARQIAGMLHGLADSAEKGSQR